MHSNSSKNHLQPPPKIEIYIWHAFKNIKLFERCKKNQIRNLFQFPFLRGKIPSNHNIMRFFIYVNLVPKIFQICLFCQTSEEEKARFLPPFLSNTCTYGLELFKISTFLKSKYFNSFYVFRTLEHGKVGI